MEPSDFDAIFIALQAAHVRYIVVGGVDVVLHGSPRFTADLDLVIALEDENVRAALAALERSGIDLELPFLRSNLQIHKRAARGLRIRGSPYSHCGVPISPTSAHSRR